MSKTAHIALAVIAGLAVLGLIIFSRSPTLPELEKARAEIGVSDAPGNK